jgi:hypothetical protein
MKGAKSLRLSAYVKGSLLHSLLEHFWDRLGTEEEVMSKSSKFKDKKYFDADGFAKYAKGKWNSIIIADERRKEGEKIHWAYDSEKWVVMNKLRDLCVPLFKYKIDEPVPESRFLEEPFSFFVGDRRFKGFVDEISFIDNKIRIIDYKSGNPWVGEMKLKHDPQLTLYAAGLCARIRDDKNFAKQFNLEGKFEDFMQGQSFISPNIDVGFCMIEALAVNPEKVRSVPNPVILSNRNDNHFLEVLKMVEGVRQRCIIGDVYPERGKKCDNCDVKYHCDEELVNANKGYMVDKSGQFEFGFSMPAYIRREDYTKKVKQPKRDPAQKRIRFKYKKT